MDKSNHAITLATIGLAFSLYSCSGYKALSSKEIPKILGHTITQSALFVDDSANTVCISQSVDGKPTTARKVEGFSGCRIPASSSSLVLSGEEILLADGHTIVCGTLANAALIYDSKLEPNSDTSALLLTAASPKLFEGKSRQLFLLKAKTKQVTEVASFHPQHACIVSPVPFTPNQEFRYYELQSEARWIDDSTFAFVSTDGVSLHSIRDPNYHKVLFDQPTNSNFAVSGRYLFIQTRSGIFKVSIDGRRIDTLYSESGTTHLRVQGDEVYFVHGWRLYRLSRQRSQPDLVFKASNIIRDFWIAPDGRAVLRVAAFESSAEASQFVSINLHTSDAVQIENSRAEIVDADMSDDHNYFVISKKTVSQFKMRNVILVYDLSRSVKHEFDLDAE